MLIGCARFEPPTIRERGAQVRATAQAMHEAAEAMKSGARAGRLTCALCGETIHWSGNGSRSAGSCVAPGCTRWAT